MDKDNDSSHNSGDVIQIHCYRKKSGKHQCDPLKKSITRTEGTNKVRKPNGDMHLKTLKLYVVNNTGNETFDRIMNEVLTVQFISGLIICKDQTNSNRPMVYIQNGQP